MPSAAIQSKSDKISQTARQIDGQTDGHCTNDPYMVFCFDGGTKTLAFQVRKL